MVEAQQMLRIADVLKLRGKKRTSHYADIGKGLFTPPVQIGVRQAAWPLSEVEAINRARLAGKSDDQIRKLVRNMIVARAMS